MSRPKAFQSAAGPASGGNAITRLKTDRAKMFQSAAGPASGGNDTWVLIQIGKVSIRRRTRVRRKPRSGSAQKIQQFAFQSAAGPASGGNIEPIDYVREQLTFQSAAGPASGGNLDVVAACFKRCMCFNPPPDPRPAETATRAAEPPRPRRYVSIRRRTRVRRKRPSASRARSLRAKFQSAAGPASGGNSGTSE